ncbi:MAG: PhzF family phenazine biosynthesis protein [Solirubrobacterales bacterium]|nr:PhzF family phenazine biosynthesis protein [Solirubrobacterales bacterium]
MRSYVVLDVFTDAPLEGNSVAVFTDGAGLSDELMQRTAREMNLSETVFLLPGENGADARARIFTPTAELPFAGHPVLGTAFLLGERLQKPVVRLQTGAGTIPIELERAGDRVTFGEMQQPIPVQEPFEAAAELLEALSVERSRLPVTAYRNGPLHVYVALWSDAEVAALRPDAAALTDIADSFGVSCFAVSEIGVKTRMFAPALGVNEDPATGSAAGPLAVHLVKHGEIGFGQRVEIRQGAEIGRPSLLYARVEGTAAEIERVLVGGSAVLVAEGSYRLT